MDLYEDPKDKEKIADLTDELSMTLKDNEIGIIIEALTSLIAEIIIDVENDKIKSFVWAYHIQKEIIEKSEKYSEWLDENNMN